MKAYILLLFLLLGIAYIKAVAGECTKFITNATGTITVDGSTPVNESCTYIIWRNSSINTALQVKKIALKDNDTLVIYDGNKQDNMTIANYTAGSRGGFQVAVGFQENVTIIFTLGGTNTTSAWSIDYDTKECKLTVDNIWISRVDSPFYVPTKNFSKLSCTYIVKSDDLYSDQRAVASLSRFKMTGNSSITVSSNTQNITYKENNPLYDFFPGDTNTFVIEINIANASTPQSFSMLVSVVASECSGTVMLKSPYYWTHLPIQSVGYECRLLFNTTGNRLGITAHVISLDVASGNNRLTFINGVSSSDQVLATVTANVKDYMVIGSAESMMVSIVVDNTDEQRSINLTLTETVYGGRLTGEGSLEFQNKTDDTSVYYQLIAKQDQVVKVEVLSDIPEGSNVTFYNGLQMSDFVLIVLRHDAQNIKNVIGSSNMLVEISNFKTGSNFSASFTSINPDCNVLATNTSGQISHSKQSDPNCTLIIAPQRAEGTIILNIDSLKLGETESVEVYSGLDRTTLLAHFIGPVVDQMNPLQIYVLVRDRISIVVRVAAAASTPSVVMHYQTVSEETCGRYLKVPTDNILTPNYPNQYPLNAHCIWFPDKLTDKFLYLSFQDLVLFQNHTISVINTTNQTSHQVIASYGGVKESLDELPEDLVFSLTTDTQIEFQSSQSLKGNINQVGRGVNISSRVMDCGGTFYGNESFQTFNYPYPLNKTSFCVWIVDVKGKRESNTTNIVNFTIDAIDDTVVDQYLKIYDGNSTRARLLTINLAESRSYLSRYDKLVVVVNYIQETSHLKAGIRFNFTTKDCQANEMCDNGICLHADWRCNGIDDCGDNTDERNCNQPSTTTPSTPSAEGHSGWVKSGWIPACLFIGVLLGAILVFVVPKLIHRLRTRGGNYSRMGDNTANA